MRSLLLLATFCALTSQALAQTVDIYTEPVVPVPHTVHRWVTRDSNALWKHDGPDTGLIRVFVKPWGNYTGHLISHDSNWVTIVNERGLKEEILTRGIASVSDFLAVIDTSGPQHLRSREDRAFAARPYESFIAPTALLGTTFPNNGASGVFAWNLGAFYGFRLPHASGNFGGFISANVESKTFELDETSGGADYWTTRYLSATAGISFRGFVSAGLTVAVPYPGASQRTFFSNSSSVIDRYFAQRYTIATNLIRTNLEPRLALALPLKYYPQSQQVLMFVAEAGYPLSPVFWNDLPESQFPKLSDVRLPEVTIGLSYVLPMFDRYRSGGLLVE